ncbi:MAG TPA: aldehyde dehydrogenase family protein [Chthoniobacterales bacterium]
MPAESDGEIIANYTRASRKDFRDAVGATRKAQAEWSKQSACFARTDSLSRRRDAGDAPDGVGRRDRARRENGTDRRPTKRGSPSSDSSTTRTDRQVQPIFSAVNPVASSHFDFNSPEPSGIVVILCFPKPPLLALVSLVAPAILSGNTAAVLASRTKPLPALTFAEITATSDLPAGVVNILSGDPAELAPYIAEHMDLNAIVDVSGAAEIAVTLQQAGGFNVKRHVQRDLPPSKWRTSAAENPYWILETIEMKTARHPIEL